MLKKRNLLSVVTLKTVEIAKGTRLTQNPPALGPIWPSCSPALALMLTSPGPHVIHALQGPHIRRGVRSRLPT